MEAPRSSMVLSYSQSCCYAVVPMQIPLLPS